VTGAYPSALSKGSGGTFFITVLWAISWLIKIELKQIYCSFSRNKKIQNGFQSFLLVFLRSILLLNRNKNIGNDLLVFHKFPFPSTFILLPLPYRCFGVPEKKHEWKRSIVANKSQILKPMFPLSYENPQYHQNRRQKVFNRVALRLCRGLDILQFKLNWFVVFNTVEFA